MDRIDIFEKEQKHDDNDDNSFVFSKISYPKLKKKACTKKLKYPEIEGMEKEEARAYLKKQGCSRQGAYQILHDYEHKFGIKFKKNKKCN